jgi:hypothetical protein
MSTKLTADDALKIRLLYADGMRASAIGHRFGCSPQNVFLIVGGKAWVNAGGPIRPPATYPVPCRTTAGHGAGEYRHGCRCPEALDEKRRRAKRVAWSEYRQVSALSAQRRIAALGAMGWSHREVARRLGYVDCGSLTNFLYCGGGLTTRTDRAIRKLYDDLRGQQGPSSRARTLARNKGWPAPSHWDDIDNPDEVPGSYDVAKPARDELDEVAVERALLDARAGRKVSVTLTKAERDAVAAQLPCTPARWALGINGNTWRKARSA